MSSERDDGARRPAASAATPSPMPTRPMPTRPMPTRPLEGLIGADAPRVAPDDAYRHGDGGFWVFGYGSLMWSPGFDFVERRPATLSGYARAFCLWSVRYRGTTDAPGLVLGLKADPDARTHGVAFRVGAENSDVARRYLIERELITASYRETVVALACEAGARHGDAPAPETTVTAITYVVDRAQPQYAGGLSLEDQARVIAHSEGGRGPNHAYLTNTLAHLREVGVPEDELSDFAWLEARVDALRA